VIAFSTAAEIRRTKERRTKVWAFPELPNDCMSPLFQAAIEATEEAIYNALSMASTVSGYKGRKVDALPLDDLQKMVQSRAK
jgi:D-aminopeptidase